MLLVVAITSAPGNPLTRYYDFQMCGEYVNVVLGDAQAHVHGVYRFKTVGQVSVASEYDSKLTPNHMWGVFLPVYSLPRTPDSLLRVEVRYGGRKLRIVSEKPYPMMFNLPLPQGMVVRWFTFDLDTLTQIFMNYVLGPRPQRFSMSDDSMDYASGSKTPVARPEYVVLRQLGFTIEVEYDQPLFTDSLGKGFMYTPIIPHKQAKGRYELCIEARGTTRFTLDRDSSEGDAKPRCVALTHLKPVVARLKLGGTK